MQERREEIMGRVNVWRGQALQTRIPAEKAVSDPESASSLPAKTRQGWPAQPYESRNPAARQQGSPGTLVPMVTAVLGRPWGFQMKGVVYLVGNRSSGLRLW